MERVPYMSPVSLPLLVATSVFLAQLLSVGTAEDRPNMGVHKQGMYIPLFISIQVYFLQRMNDAW